MTTAAGVWHVYLLQCADGTQYCGIAMNLQKRLRQHNGELAGGARYTAGRRPVRLLASIPVKSRGEALRLEAHIKKLPAHAKLQLLTDNSIWPALK